MAPQPPRPSSRGAHLHDARHPHDSPRRGQTQPPVRKAAPPRRARHSSTSTSTSTGSAAFSDQHAAHVTSFWNGPDPVPLPSRFARIKRSILAGREDALEASWTRLLAALRRDVEHIDGLGAHLIPSIEFGDLDDEGQTARFQRDLRRYGVGVVRKVVPRGEAEDAVKDTVRYVEEAQQQQKGTAAAVGAGGAEPIDPACWNLFWSPAQTRMRAHANVRKAQQFMMSMWDTDGDGHVSTQHPITYADRIRVYGTEEAARPANHSENNGIQTETTRGGGGGGTAAAAAAAAAATAQAAPPPQSAEDWITALQSSDGIIAQVDNGSLERWEPDGYARAGTYASILAGAWERHDPWSSARRSPATTDLYNGHGACSVFRMFQGVLALSVVEPGTVRLLPSPRAATAYYLLRPFFAPRAPLPDGPSWERSTPEDRAATWERHIAPDNWTLTRDPDTVIHGAVPGHAQRVTERWHPHLHLRSSMITLPTLQPGDYILWHPDLPYHISSCPDERSLGASASAAADAWKHLRVLVYIPAVPLTQTSALYLARQRKAFQRGQPAPDFDSSGRRSQPAEDHDTAAAEADMERVGGRDALRAMGLAPWDVSDLVTRPSTPSEVALLPGTNGAGGEELGKASDTVRLANIILFPETSLLG
ncbi:hypothetical protein PWT90_02912 [Aphanocladium album]|nr:hypothetical protein PWT90_02912 [Aphanocladium album]